MRHRSVNKLFIIGVKYCPILLLISCSIKIYFSCVYYFEITIINIINLILNFILLGLVYVQGITLRFCYIHRSLCRLTFWGYLYYSAFLINTPLKIEALPIIYFYLILSIIIPIAYEVIRKYVSNFRYNRDSK